jgi:uncharacterized MAPEG superfamily protein
MQTISGFVLTGFIAWALLLLLWMEGLRTWLVLRGAVPANGFTPGNDGLSPFMQRLARAHANCVESLPVFGGLLLVAIATDRPQVTDTLAPAFLAARIMQSCIHLASTSAAAVSLRFTAFAVQLAIAAWWAWALLAG